MHCRNLFGLFWLLVDQCIMKDYRIEFDVKLWTYVLHYQGQKYALNVNRVTQAFERSQLVLSRLKRDELELGAHDGSSSNIVI